MMPSFPTKDVVSRRLMCLACAPRPIHARHADAASAQTLGASYRRKSVALDSGVCRNHDEASPQILRLDVLPALRQRDQEPVLAENGLAVAARVGNPAHEHAPHQPIWVNTRSGRPA